MLALAMAYALFGWVSLRVAAANGYATPLFPPAGIALSACLIFSPRLWPGIFIGSALVQFGAGEQALISGSAWWGSLAAPFGATLQALVGTALARRLLALPDPLDTPRSALIFLGVIAPLSSLICASLAVPALVWSGAMARADAAFSWWNWWLGDSMGVLIAAPLMFAFFGRPREDWRSRRLAIGVPLVLALLILVGAFIQVRGWEEHRLQVRFDRDAELLASLVRDRLRLQLEMLRALERFVAVTDELDRDAFHAFVAPWQARHPGVQNFGWSPRVEDPERAAFEARMSASGLPDFHILGRDPDGQTFPAAAAKEYFPIVYVEPVDGNRGVIGLDPSILPSTATPIALTRELDEPVASEPFRLVQETQSQRSVAVYEAVRDPASGAEKGLLSGVFRMDDILGAALSEVAAQPIELCLADLGAAPGNSRLSGAPGCEGDGWLGRSLSWKNHLEFGGRRWQLSFRATPEYAALHRSWAAWTTFAVGMLVIALLGAFLLISSGRTRRIEDQVAQRTRQLRAARDRVHAQQAALARAQRVAKVGSWEWDPTRSRLEISEELARLLDLDAATTLALEDLIARVHPEDRPHLRSAFEDAYAVEHGANIDCRLADAHGEAPVARFTIERTPAESGLHGLRGTVQDVTAERRAEAHIHYLAHYDALTKLPNRTLWQERAHTALAAAQRHGDRLAVLFLDLDQFKTINDSLGHPIGDRLLTKVAERLTHCLREEDMLARLGGDEFVALLPRLSHEEDASVVAGKMLATLGRPITIDQHELSISVSIGVALYPEDGEDVDTLLKHADTAMYRAKELGRNNFQYFTADMNSRALQRLMLESALRRAIARDELALFYQPQVNAVDGRLVGCEALVRWRHPEMGLIGPTQFIPVAEDCGLIVALGEWVLREACRQQLRWHEAGYPPLDIAVNISALQFRQEDFVSTVARILHQTKADPCRLELEITESTLMQPTEELLERLQKLRALGLTLALDDFGTGYSSLAYLKRLPISRLKLDRSFVKDLPGDAEDAAISSATLSMAKNLALDVVAEGVETEAQREFLVARECRVLQGYLYGRPEPAERFETLFLANPRVQAGDTA